MLHILIYDYTVIYPVAACLLCLLVVYLQWGYWQQSTTRYAWLLLSLLFFMYAFILGYAYLMFSNTMVHTPHLFRLGSFIYLLFLPVSFFYWRFSFSGVRWRWQKDIWHFLPALVYLMDYFPFFIQSAAYKVEVYTALSTYGEFVFLAEGWFMPKGGHFLFRFLLMTLYWILQLNFYLQSPKDFTVVQRRWFTIILISQAVVFVLPALNLIFPLGSRSQLNAAVCLLVAGIQSYYLIKQRKLLLAR